MVITTKITKKPRFVISSKGRFKNRRNQIGQSFVVSGIFQEFLILVLFYLAPEVFSMWYIRVSSISDNYRLLIGGFASVGSDLGSGLSFSQLQGEPMFIIVIATIIIGMIIGLMGAGGRSKGVAIVGGLLLMVSFLVIIVVISGGIGLFSEVAEILGLLGQNALYGSYSDMFGKSNKYDFNLYKLFFFFQFVKNWLLQV